MICVDVSVAMPPAQTITSYTSGINNVKPVDFVIIALRLNPMLANVWEYEIIFFR
ncbi:MAG: hypothetical protein RL311_10 [Bacteroidota bacterium]|jgi:hypothetical protein